MSKNVSEVVGKEREIRFFQTCQERLQGSGWELSKVDSKDGEMGIGLVAHLAMAPEVKINSDDPRRDLRTLTEGGTLYRTYEGFPVYIHVEN